MPGSSRLEKLLTDQTVHPETFSTFIGSFAIHSVISSSSVVVISSSVAVIPLINEPSPSTQTRARSFLFFVVFRSEA